MIEFEKEWKMVKPSAIHVDPLYQRAINTKRIARMVQEWNPNLVNPPKLSFRDGKYWVFDGQHTIALWRQIYKGNDKAIECRVFYGMTWLDESELFCLQNGISKDPTTNEKLHAAYNAGNREVCDMVENAKLAGITVDFSRSTSPWRCCATAALFKAYQMLGRGVFLEMLTVISKAWQGEPDSLTGVIISGMAKFYKTYYGRFSANDLASTLGRVSPSYIIREGRGLNGRAQNKYFAVILREYNKRRSKNRLENEIYV